MVGVEHLARMAQLEHVLGGVAPGQVEHPLEVGAHQVTVGRVLGQGGQALELALGLGERLLREIRGLDLLAQLVHLAQARVGLAELVLDLAHAASEHPLASPGVDLFRLGLVAQGALGLGDRDLTLEVPLDAQQAHHRVRLLQELDALLGRDRQVRGDQVGEHARRRDAREERLPLGRHVVAEVDHLLGLREHALPRFLVVSRGERWLGKRDRAGLVNGAQ